MSRAKRVLVPRWLRSSGRALEAFCPVAEDLRGQLLLTTLDTFNVDACRQHLVLTTTPQEITSRTAQASAPTWSR